MTLDEFIDDIGKREAATNEKQMIIADYAMMFIEFTLFTWAFILMGM